MDNKAQLMKGMKGVRALVGYGMRGKNIVEDIVCDSERKHFRDDQES